VDKQFQIIFFGRAVADLSVEQLKINIAKLYKTEVKNIESLFSGQTVVIKDNLDKDTADKYAAVFRKQGAQCEVRDKTVADNTTQSPSPSTAPIPVSETPQVVTASTSTTVVTPENEACASTHDVASAETTGDFVNIASKCTVEIDKCVGSMSGISVAETGESMAKLEHVEAPKIDINNLNLAAAGETLIDYIEVEEPDISIDSLSLAPGGANLKD